MTGDRFLIYVCLVAAGFVLAVMVGARNGHDLADREQAMLDTCDGESGPGARPFNVEWARSTIKQCREAGGACFVKQLGPKPYRLASDSTSQYFFPVRVADKKGSDPSEWPEDLRVQEWP